ncbi:MAG: FHA domain-containing protein [Vicinamibacteria bacterium]|jgi:pSer/pThr/pTyr-binding forkhead associated (FHA) protein|nr:FHA domain-containing protein [Vicinamibacteria bacterium]
MTWQLVTRCDDGTLRSVPLEQTALIGASWECEVAVSGEGVEPQHARIQISEDGAWIENVGRSGTRVNGQTISRRALAHLDVITVGEGVSLLTLWGDRAAAPTRAMAANLVRPPESLDARTMLAMKAVAPALPPESLDARTRLAMKAVAPAVPPVSLQEHTVLAKQGAPLAAPPKEVDTPYPVAKRRGPTGSHSAPQPSPPPTPAPNPPAPQGTSGAPILLRLSGPHGIFETGEGRCIVGRDGDATFQIDSRDVSRRHAMISVSRSEIRVQDLNSSNGTRLNGAPVHGIMPLKDGDQLAFSTFLYRVQVMSGNADR